MHSPLIATAAIRRATRSLRDALLAALVCFVACCGSAVIAAPATPVATDAALERRVTTIAEELRCLVCQNQSIADSHAELAVDLRNQIRERLRSGASDADVIAFMTARYGDFILYRPPMKQTTLALWFGPLVILAIGAAVATITLRRRSRELAADGPDAEDDDATDDVIDGQPVRNRASPPTGVVPS